MEGDVLRQLKLLDLLLFLLDFAFVHITEMDQHIKEKEHNNNGNPSKVDEDLLLVNLVREVGMFRVSVIFKVLELFLKLRSEIIKEGGLLEELTFELVNVMVLVSEGIIDLLFMGVELVYQVF